MVSLACGGVLLTGCSTEPGSQSGGGGATAGLTTVGVGSTGDGDSGGSEESGEPDFGTSGGETTGDTNAEICGNGLDEDGDGGIDEQCACTTGTTQPCYPDGVDDPCPGTQTCTGAGEITSWGECEVDEAACEPEGTTGGEEIEPCEGELQTATQVLTFQSPLQTLGSCPWGQGDNLGHTSGVMAARHEVTLPLQPPEGAVPCSTRFEVPETSMYYDDQLFVLFNDVVILSPGDWGDRLMTEDGLLIYDWMQIRGTNGSGTTYCPGAGSTCQLPDTQQDGSIDLELDVLTQEALLERAALQGSYAITVAATGDDNADIDCDHSTFDLEVTYEYAVQ